MSIFLMDNQIVFLIFHPPLLIVDMEDHNKAKKMVEKNFKLGKNTDIGAFTYINAKNVVEIADEVQIGSHCSIYSVSTIDNKAGKVTLKKNCKIGSHSVIMPRITVGENSVIGAFSFVNKNIPANVVAFGVPVKVIKKL